MKTNAVIMVLRSVVALLNPPYKFAALGAPSHPPHEERDRAPSEQGHAEDGQRHDEERSRETLSCDPSEKHPHRVGSKPHEEPCGPYREGPPSYERSHPGGNQADPEGPRSRQHAEDWIGLAVEAAPRGCEHQNDDGVPHGGEDRSAGAAD
jgi:hypothetical protein